NLIEQRLSSHLRHNYTSLQSSRPGEDRECFRTVMSIHPVLSGRTGKEPPVKETTWIINSQSGELTVEGLQQSELIQLAADLLPSGKSVNCARPINIQPLRNSSPRVSDGEPFLRVFRIYHDSVVEGPGRRSVVQTAGCNLRCPGFVPETYDINGGVEMKVSEIVERLLAPEGASRDGVTILGGE